MSGLDQAQEVAQGLWRSLSGMPVLWLSVTLAAYVVADWLSRRSGRHPMVNTVAIAVALIAAVLLATGTTYGTYIQGAQLVHFLLGPATVALAVPLVENAHRVRRAALPILAALVAGSLTAILCAVGIARMLGAGPGILASLAPKSVTAPIAMGVSERLGGSASLAAALVICTGVVGAMIGGPMFNALGIRDFAARGFATGLAAHGIGTARAFQVHEVAGIFAGIAMALNGILTALVLPLISGWLLR